MNIFTIYGINNTNASDINNIYHIPLKTLYNWEKNLRVPPHYILLLLEMCETHRKD